MPLWVSSRPILRHWSWQKCSNMQKYPDITFPNSYFTTPTILSIIYIAIYTYIYMYIMYLSFLSFYFNIDIYILYSSLRIFFCLICRIILILPSFTHISVIQPIDLCICFCLSIYLYINIYNQVTYIYINTYVEIY